MRDFVYGETINTQAIAFDGGGLYLADTTNRFIRYYRREEILIRFRTGGVSYSFNLDRPPKVFSWNYTSGTINYNFVATRVVKPVIQLTTGSPTFEFNVKSNPTINGWSLSTGSPTFEFQAATIGTKYFSWNYTTGEPTYEIETDQVTNRNFPFSFTSDAPTFDFLPSVFVPPKKYFILDFKTQEPKFSFEAITVEVPNLVEANLDAVLVPIEVVRSPSGTSEVAKYTAIGRYEITAERTLTPRARVGDTFSGIEYSFPKATREPMVITPPIPQLLPPTLLARQQANAIILRWSYQPEVLSARSQLQVSENEEGPWFAPDTTNSPNFITGDSGGVAETEGF